MWLGRTDEQGAEGLRGSMVGKAKNVQSEVLKIGGDS